MQDLQQNVYVPSSGTCILNTQMALPDQPRKIIRRLFKQTQTGSDTGQMTILKPFLEPVINLLNSAQSDNSNWRHLYSKFLSISADRVEMGH